VAELGARSVLDVGLRDGLLGDMLAQRGYEVVGVDPAEASLAVARAKPGAQRVRWIHGDVMSLPALAVDLATMTGNVSNVFLTQQEWLATLGGVHAALRPGGHLVFESADPAALRFSFAAAARNGPINLSMQSSVPYPTRSHSKSAARSRF
jgi:SAM-dependent methyltransferase